MQSLRGQPAIADTHEAPVTHSTAALSSFVSLISPVGVLRRGKNKAVFTLLSLNGDRE